MTHVVDPNLLAGYADPRLPLRYWRHVQPDPVTGHWLWIGAINPGDGIPRFYVGRTASGIPIMRTAPRVLWEALYGPLPTDVHVRRVCGNSLCVRPSHLAPVRPLSRIVVATFAAEAGIADCCEAEE